MARAMCDREGCGSVSGRSIEVVVDPKMPDLERTIKDILRVSREVKDLLPGLTMTSIEIERPIRGRENERS